jgi:D-proline reductase (dithiol) PrdB
MVYLHDYPQEGQSHILDQDLLTFDTNPWVDGPPLSQRRVAVVTTAGLHCRGDRPFGPMNSEYRIIPKDTPASELMMSHVSTNYDRTGFQQDINVVLPLERLRTLVDDGTIGSLADYHYSFMGATPPDRLEAAARDLAGVMKGDNVDAVLLVPV